MVARLVRRVQWRGGLAVDAAVWQFETGADRLGNQELQYYTDGTANAALDGAGNLAIMVRQVALSARDDRFAGCAYTSARLTTKDCVTCCYGVVEARIQVPVGVWPAFWMLGTDIDAVGWPRCGEIDVMETFGRDAAVVHGTVHGPGYAGRAGITAAYTASTTLASAFHRYAVAWEPDRVPGTSMKSCTTPSRHRTWLAAHGCLTTPATCCSTSPLAASFRNHRTPRSHFRRPCASIMFVSTPRPRDGVEHARVD